MGHSAAKVIDWKYGQTFTQRSAHRINWAGNKAGEGFEYHLLAIWALLPVVIAGPGRFAVGGLLSLHKVPGKERLVWSRMQGRARFKDSMHLRRSRREMELHEERNKDQ